MKKTPEERARMMRAFRKKDTAPEIAVRRLAHQMGYRFRLYRRDLPGNPDIVFPSRKKVIFVHGCFWHCHGCELTRLPRRNLEYWVPKLNRNRTRDARNLGVLEAEGWSYLVIWECEVSDLKRLQARLKAFLK
jgi:DNA mismatch endonuclease (patch repair protein)